MFCDYIQPKIKLQKDVQKKMTPGVKVKNNQESKKKPHLIWVIDKSWLRKTWTRTQDCSMKKAIRSLKIEIYENAQYHAENMTFFLG